MGGLAAVDPDGLGVVDEHVVDGREFLLASHGHEAGFDAWARRRGQVGCDGFAGFGEAGFGDCVVLIAF